MQYNTKPMFVMATRQQWRQRNLNCISSRNPDCVAETETLLSLLCSVFQTLSSSVLCAALNVGSSTLSQPFRLYLQKHEHKIIFIVHSICPAMTPHKTSTLKIWGVNTLDSSLQTLREVVLSVRLIKLRCVFIYLGPYSDHLPMALQHVKKSDSSSGWWVTLPTFGSSFCSTMSRHGQTPLEAWRPGSSSLAPESTKGLQQDDT